MKPKAGEMGGEDGGSGSTRPDNKPFNSQRNEKFGALNKPKVGGKDGDAGDGGPGAGPKRQDNKPFNKFVGPMKPRMDGEGGSHGGGPMRQDNKPFHNQRNNKFGGGPIKPRGLMDGEEGEVGYGGGPMRQDNKFFNNQGNDGKFRQRRFPGNKKPEGGGMGMFRNHEDRLHERLEAIGGPTYELPPIDMSEKKFSGRNRLFIGNLPAEVTEEELLDIFKPFGETGEFFLNKEKSFSFIRLDFHENAEKAKREVDGTVFKGRPLKVRFAPNSSTIKVKNLSHFVTNELLHLAFSVFGEVERCVVIVDDRGKTTGEGIVEFARKPNAQHALKACQEGCFFLTSSLRPVIAELHEQLDDMDGLPEKNLLKKNNDYHHAREVGPRFAAQGSFEHNYGTRWKQLHDLFKQKELSLKQELQMEQNKLEAQMQFAKFESETEMLREELRIRELDRERQKREWQERERMAEEQRVRNEELMRRQQDEMERRMSHQEDNTRRRQQENTLFMQAHQLSNILDQQEQAIDNLNTDFDNAGDTPMDPQSFLDSYERGHHRDDMGGPGGSKRRRY